MFRNFVWNEKMKKRRTYGDEDLVWWSRHLDGEGSKISELMSPLERTKCTQDKTRCRRRQSSHNFLSIWVEFLYIQFPICILQELTPLFIMWGCWKIGGKIQMKLIWNSHQKQVTWEVWPFSTMTPPKNYIYTYSPKSHG